MDRPEHAGQRTVFLLRWSCARLSRSAHPTAPPLRGPRTLVPAGDHRLLDPCHGRAALLVREQGGRPGAPDCDFDYEFSGGVDDGGSVALRAMVSGKFLPLYAGALWFRSSAGVWN